MSFTVVSVPVSADAVAPPATIADPRPAAITKAVIQRVVVFVTVTFMDAMVANVNRLP